MRKKKKGKLDPQATVLLKTWWTAHVVWPYPTVSTVTLRTNLESVNN